MAPLCFACLQHAFSARPPEPLAASQHVALAALNPNIQSHLISFISLIQYKSYHYNSSPVSIYLYTTFTVLPLSTSFSNTFRLSLAFVDCYSKCQSNRKLPSSKWNQQIFCSWWQCDPRNKYHFSWKSPVSTHNPTFQYSPSDCQHPQSGIITKSLRSIQIPK